MADSLFGLGHDAVIGGYDQHGDVGNLSAARSHGGERFVPGGVEEGDKAVVVVDLIRADVLRDAAGFAVHDVGLAYGVEQGCLAVVDVSEDGYDWWALFEHGRVVVFGRGYDRTRAGLIFERQNLKAERGGDFGDELVLHDLVDGEHVAATHELLDDLDGRGFHQVGKVVDDYCQRDLQGFRLIVVVVLVVVIELVVVAEFGSFVVPFLQLYRFDSISHRHPHYCNALERDAPIRITARASSGYGCFACAFRLAISSFH